MPSERRLHPASVLFGLVAQLREFAVPLIALLFTAGSAGWGWQAWTALLIVPYSLVAILRYFSFRYRYDENEMVIRTGFIFRNERHVPYARIQNVDAVQNVLHRLLGVLEVRVQTGGGQEPEARFSVLPVAALDEMRHRVLGSDRGQAGVGPESDQGQTTLAAGNARYLLTLPPRELALAGFIENRGMVLIAAGFGLLWELGVLDGAVDALFGEQTSGRGAVRDLARAVFAGREMPLGRIALMLGAFVAFLLVVRVLSMIWAAIRLHGFQLTRAGDDLRTEFGLLTRVVMTIPVHRIQTLTVREGPLHRLFGRAAVRVDTAGGHGGGGNLTQREWLAPIVERRELDRLLAEILPELDVHAVSWLGVAPGAFRRAFKAHAILAALVSLPFLAWLGWWGVGVLAPLLGWAALTARKYIDHVRWATTDTAVVFKDGWIWRQMTVARFTKIQTVSLRQSPFDRRAAMASVAVDTAGAGDLSHRVNVPYLTRSVADELAHRLAAEAGRTAFKW
jgi:putative membrane protein